ncbi:trypsin-like serine protease (plasmid) [Deinococcus taeanensis]|uniref:trypsin-like serine protease n=1 Tax=Deinococcus taeanensis TaxID=2737050 RepID=UPI001CDD5D47|nr:trypsin-like serine protease [Deinococcus taeanensis]UBV45220.1 trypsin-like serine protease [Deinococcus taeanensis]
MPVTRNRWLLGALLSVTAALTSCGTGPAAGVPADQALHAQVISGQRDGTAHPNVALLVFYNADNQAMFRCTGTLVDANTVLTAGHCTADEPGAEIAYVRAYFDPEVDRTLIRTNTGGYVGDAVAHPLYGTGFPNTYDIGVVELGANVVGIEPATIAPEGTLDSLATGRGQQDVTFLIVGYGLQGVKPVGLAELVRYSGNVQLVNLRSALTGGYNLHLTSNAGKGTGGSGLCFGDSGGAVFYGKEELIVAVNSFVLNQQCQGAGFSYRTDTDVAQDFLAAYVDGLTAD